MSTAHVLPGSLAIVNPWATQPTPGTPWGSGGSVAQEAEAARMREAMRRASMRGFGEGIVEGSVAPSDRDFDWQRLVGGIGKGLVDIFGNPMTPPVYTPPPRPAIPSWVWIAAPVAVVGIIALSRKKKRLAGYRRRR